ncbi:MAG: helix-turn-helix transcriptional regulator [Blautia sp.]|nr:helix-turn-helix transcriptional regulator [Blautia sp.]
MKEETILSAIWEQKEQARHGDIFLPVGSYHCLVPDTYTELSLHWHEEMEITLIREGISNYRVGQQSFQAREGDLILVPPYILHSAMEIPGQGMVSDSLVFHLDFLGASQPDLSASRYVRPLLQGQLHMPARLCRGDMGYEKLCGTFLEAFACFHEKKAYYELALKELLLHILYLLFSSGHITDLKTSKAEQENYQQFHKALRFISEHYREHLTISELARVSGFSESYFMSLFKKKAGMTCVQYINLFRIQKAAEALENSSQPVMEVAMDHGFDNISYFNLQFRRRFGMTPRAFRMLKQRERGRRGIPNCLDNDGGESYTFSEKQQVQERES